MDEQGINHQNSQSHDRFVDQIRWADFMGFNNHLPNTSMVPTPSKVPNAFPPNSPILQPGSVLAFLHPPNPGVVPYNLSMPPTNSTEQTSPPSQPSRKKKSAAGARCKEHWTAEEDVELCLAWLKISEEDPVVGTGQRQEAFWKRVTDHFNSQMNDKGRKDSSRTKDAAISRWATIHPAVTRWTALHATLTKNLPPSSLQVPQLEDRTRTMYYTRHKEVFKFEDCWKVLRDSNKWQTWVQERVEATGEGGETSLQDTSTQPISQHDATSVPAESDLHSTPCDGNPRSVCTAGSERILAALIDVDAKAEERIRRQDDLKRRRDEILDQQYQEQKQQYHEQRRMIEREHAATMGSKRIQLLRDLKYLTDQLVETYKDLEAIDESSILTPREQLEYDTKREWVERLQAERAEMNLLIDMTKIQSPDARPPTSGGSTSGITPGSG